MDNNILASDYGIEQIQKIIDRGYRVDFNQALDARLVTDDIAKLLAQVRWLNVIRFGCDTPKQIHECEKAMSLIDSYRGKPAHYLMYTMIADDFTEAVHRLSYWKKYKRVRIVAQPFRDVDNPNQIIPQWQKDLAHWSMRRVYYASCEFRDFQVRKNFNCKEYFYMRVTKLTDLYPVQDEDGKWNVFCQVYMGNSYVYGAIVTDTLEEALTIKEGQMLDIEKVKFSRRTNNISK